MMLSDWLWVARERSLGDTLVFYPSSSTLGAVMVPAQSPIKSLADLKGRKLAIAGGPLDKSWLLLQGLARRSGLDLGTGDDRLRRSASLSEKALQGETDATLTSGILRRSRKQRPPPRDRYGGRHEDLAPKAPSRLSAIRSTGPSRRVTARRSTASSTPRGRQQILASSDAEWQRLAPRIGTRDAKALAIYRQRYSDGIVRRPIAEEEADARALYHVLAETGGTDLIGPARELAAGTFYHPAAAE